MIFKLELLKEDGSYEMLVERVDGSVVPAPGDVIKLNEKRYEVVSRYFKAYQNTPGSLCDKRVRLVSVVLRPLGGYKSQPRRE